MGQISYHSIVTLCQMNNRHIYVPTLNANNQSKSTFVLKGLPSGVMLNL